MSERTSDEIKDDLRKALGWPTPIEDKPRVERPKQTNPADMIFPKSKPGAQAAGGQPVAPVAQSAVTPAVVTPPVTPVEPPKPPSTDEIIQRTAAAVGQSIAERIVVPPEPVEQTPPASLPEMGPEDKADYETLLRLEEVNPEKFAGKAQAFADYIAKLYAYQDKWAAENPGAEFQAADHADWFASNTAPITEEEIDRGRTDLNVAEMVEAKVKPILERDKERQKLEAYERHVPAIAEQVTRRIGDMVTLVDGELAKLIAKEGGGFDISQANQDRVNAADPISAREIKQTVDGVMLPMLLELHKTLIPELDFKFDPENNSVHAEIVRLTHAAEAKIMARPEHERIKDGKNFVSIENYKALARRAEASADPEAELKYLERAYWTLEQDEVAAEIVGFAAAEAKRRIADMDAIALAKYGPKGGAGQSTRPASVSSQGGPPSLASGSDLVSVPGTSGASGKNPAQLATSVLFG